MENFLQNPNLPNGKVSLVLVDGRISQDIGQELKKFKIKVLKTDKIDNVYDAVSYHPDIMLCHLGKEKIIAAPNTPDAVIFDLEDEGFTVIPGNKPVGAKYPENISYNTALFGSFAVCNIKYTDKMLLDCLVKDNIKIIDVKQGYSKCSICVVHEKAVITSDMGIYKALVKEDIDVLLINPGFIDLYDMDYGFIGGAAGFISNNELAFSGNALLHPDYENIKNFLLKYDKKIINLSENRMADLGTIIPLKEYCILEP